MIVAGIGFRTGATAEAILDAIARAGGGAEALATPADKSHSSVVREAAARLDLPIIAIDPDAMTKVETLTHSTRVAALRGTGSVAEACALAAAPGGRLRAPRAVSACRMATAAIAVSGETP